ncbi:extensin family protein [Sphingomonas sp. LHG3406-1]|uniref:extensin-like domain-containing protein n=1 Tax=Sphingomonas sp. LHG3406-1 TaxID=2804617 RepID=UPI00262A83BC|nr:extensin family protein [Sphingomonas sp. LHG3406-1]
MALFVIEGAAWMKRNRSDLPWTELDLAAPPGRFTAAKIAELGQDPPRCRALLAAAGNDSRPAPDRRVSETCGYQDGTALALGITPAPAGLVTSCPVAAALTVWERETQAAAQRLLGTEVRRFVHAGSFSCRRLYGREEGAWSEHATADAVDILGFELADGRRLSVLRDWQEQGAEGAFLREARDAACRSFSTVLSPDYNEAHRDHLHLDTADRGPGGWRACR